VSDGPYADFEVNRTRTVRWAYFTAGWAFFALGLAGAVLPVVPTTPFMILALWCFARSSRRFHAWLYHHRWFGRSLQAWTRYRVVPLWVKLVALTSMSASTAYLFWRGATPWPVLVATVALVVFAIWFLARCPSRRPPEA
jgi:hypothetical protein